MLPEGLLALHTSASLTEAMVGQEKGDYVWVPLRANVAPVLRQEAMPGHEACLLCMCLRQQAVRKQGAGREKQPCAWESGRGRGRGPGLRSWVGPSNHFTALSI